jgi:ribose transport system substrate-binding protein
MRLIAFAATALLAVSVATGCSSAAASGGSTTSPSQTTTTASQTTTTASQLQAAQATVAAAMKITGLDWGLPTESFNPGKHRVAIISAGQQTPAAAAIAAAQEAAAKAMGWQASPILDSQLSTDKAADFIRQAIAQGYNAIAYCCFAVTALTGPINEALAKGIAIACASCVVTGYENKIHAANPSFTRQGDIMAAWLIASSHGNAKVVGMQDDGFPQVTVRMNEMAAKLKADCPGCTYKKVEFSSSDLANPGPPSWSAVLAQNPPGTITAAVAPYDAAAPLFLKTADQEGRDIQINSFDLASQFADLMKPGAQNVGADVASPLTIMGWASIDQLARQLANVPAWNSTNFPVALVTAANVNEIKDGDLIPPDLDYQATFMKLWKQ